VSRTILGAFYDRAIPTVVWFDEGMKKLQSSLEKLPVFKGWWCAFSATMRIEADPDRSVLRHPPQRLLLGGSENQELRPNQEFPALD